MHDPDNTTVVSVFSEQTPVWCLDSTFVFPARQMHMPEDRVALRKGGISLGGTGAKGAEMMGACEEPPSTRSLTITLH